MFRPFALSLFFLPLVVSLSVAAPVVTRAPEVFKNKEVVTIQGNDFGEKTPAAPYIWADFEHGLEPSHLGRCKHWSQVENMVWAKEGRNGKGCAKGKEGVGIWTLRADYDAWSKEGQKVYVFRHQKTNFTIEHDSQNWKIWRMWPAGCNYPDIYAAANNGRVFVEEIGPESGYYGRFNLKTMDWRTEEFIFKASSMMNEKDGLLTIKYNGAPMAEGSLMTRSRRSQAYMTKNFVVHGVAANKSTWSPPWSQDNTIFVDDVYADTSWARVMLGNGPTLLGSNEWEMQIPSEWSDNAITFHVNTGAFAKGQRAYLYVFDENGASNFAGYPVFVGEKSAGHESDYKPEALKRMQEEQP